MQHIGKINSQQQVIITKRKDNDQENNLSTKIERRKQSLLIYILIVVSNLSSGLEHLLINPAVPQQTAWIAGHCMVLFRAGVSIVSIISLANCKEIISKIFLVDTILLNQIVIICLQVFLGVIYDKINWHLFTLFGLSVITFHLVSTNFRLLMCYVYWNKCQIIIYKLSLLTTSCFYICLGAFFIATSINLTGDKDKDTMFTQYIILYISGNFGYYVEFYNKVSDYDGTAQFKDTYILIEIDEENKQNKIQQRQYFEQNNNIKIQHLQIPKSTENPLILSQSINSQETFKGRATM